MRFYLTFAYAHCSSSRISLPLLLPVRPLPIRLLCYCCPFHSMDPCTPWHSFRYFLFILPITLFAATYRLSPCFHISSLTRVLTRHVSPLRLTLLLACVCYIPWAHYSHYFPSCPSLDSAFNF